MALPEVADVEMEEALVEKDDLESLGDTSDEETADFTKSGYISDEIEEETLSIDDDTPLDMNLIQQFPCVYTDIIAEFADVEIFLISLDSLLVELTAHKYHNWMLGGQTAVFTAQINRFLTSLEDLNAKFKLVWFRDLRRLYQKDTVLSFFHVFMLTYLKQSKWAEEIDEFASPADPQWANYLHRLTPSFLLMSLENPRKEVFEEIDLQSKLPSIAIHLIANSVPVIFLNAFTINLTSVMSYRLSTKPVSIPQLDKKMLEIWSNASDATLRTENVTDCESPSDFLAKVISEEIAKADTNDDFEVLCCAALISCLVGSKCGLNRNYAAINSEQSKGPGVNVLRARRRLLEALSAKLDVINVDTVKFALNDLWDGRMIFGIFEKVAKKEAILPFRLQESFAKLHAKAGLKLSVATDANDRLLDPPSPSAAPKKAISNCTLFPVKNAFIEKLFPEQKELESAQTDTENGAATHYEDVFRTMQKWKFNRIEEKVTKPEEKITDARQLKRLNYQRQVLFRWYQGFADSLEGRGNDLLVDFSRVPRTPAAIESPPVASEDKTPKGKKPGGAQPKKGGGKPGSKTATGSKKDQILEANRQTLVKKQVESDRQKVSFATQVKGNAIVALEEVLRKLELDESKALCVYELVLRYADVFATKVQNLENVEAKRSLAIELVGKLKECFIKHWQHLDEKQKEKVKDLWISLGFEADPKKRGNKQLNLQMNVVYYQLYYGGRLIDVQSDPQKDDRVTGFSPDAWQRKMLNAVDQAHSALIIAPTSAGKTFVSYYCIEKVLRQSNDDVVVYVSPSKALTNQVCGSVYARFRNKPMVGGKTLFGTLTQEFSESATNCQVLVTIPECLEQLLLSPSLEVQQLVSKIKYVILDEVHCINTSGQGHVWEHIFLLLRCPFLALSATIGNYDVMHKWLQNAEEKKALEGTTSRVVDLIVYRERWSELELALQKLRDCPKDINYKGDIATFGRGINVQASKIKAEDEGENKQEQPATPTPIQEDEATNGTPGSSLKAFMPYGVFKPEKLRMFGIPDDQQLTARQIMEFYDVMGAVDETTKKEFEPCKFFKYEVGSDKLVWLTRTDIRSLETGLKQRFLEWLKNDPKKVNEVFSRLEDQVKEEFEKRSKPFHMVPTALHNIVPLVDDLKETDMLPALCFNEDREVCQELAIRVFNELQAREERFQASAEFQKKFNFKAENKLAKLAKRKRDEDEKAKKKGGGKGKRDEDNDDGRDDIGTVEEDQFAVQRIKLKEALAKYRLGKAEDDVLEKTLSRLKARGRHRTETHILLRLFERGIGFHHDGLNAVERGTVEILFRAGYLGIVFSTSTLALGMNMPCKTVVFGIDSPKLTPLQFRQMSGRAGRRGFDPAGTVIFMALPTSKIRRLLTASLQTLRGNAPYTTSFFLRLFNYVIGWQSGTSLSAPKEKTTKKKAVVDNMDVLSMDVRVKAVLTLLENSFALYTNPHYDQEVLKRRFKLLALFNVQLLRKLDLLNESCELTGFATVATHLSEFEPGNLLFVELLQKGAFHRLVKKYGEEQRAELKAILVNIVANLFTDKYLPIYGPYQENTDDKQPFLRPMPEDFEKIVGDYNAYVDKLMFAFLEQTSKNGNPQDPAFQITGHDDVSSIFNADIVSPLEDGLILDQSLIPTSASKQRDHRGRKVYRNSYAYDFYITASRKTLMSFNKLALNEIWYLIRDFNKILTAIKESLSAVGRPTDPVVLVFDEISLEYDKKFHQGFSMTMK